MLLPDIFGENLFDDFLGDFPFWDDKEQKKLEKRVHYEN